MRIENAINVTFIKEQDGWHTYTQYGVDLDNKAMVKFMEHIGSAVGVLNGNED